MTVRESPLALASERTAYLRSWEKLARGADMDGPSFSGPVTGLSSGARRNRQARQENRIFYPTMFYDRLRALVLPKLRDDAGRCEAGLGVVEDEHPVGTVTGRTKLARPAVVDFAK